MIGSMLDLTERNRAEELERERAELARAVASMDQVLGVVGHELRTPLAGLRAMSEFLLTDGAEETPEFGQFLRGIHAEVVRMSATVHSLLEAARLNSGKVTWNWSTFGLAPICAGAVEAVRPVVDAGRVALTLTVEPAGLAMTGDADAVRRLVLNLLSNAHRHTAAGRIDVSVRAVPAARPGAAAGVRIDVRDTGCGIRPEIRERLGEAFALNSGVVGKPHVTGTGLGLAICKGIVAAHGGDIVIESEPGRGTTVTATLLADLEAPAVGSSRHDPGGLDDLHDPGGPDNTHTFDGVAA
jgi:signal transduction histidine kinase